VSGTWRIAGRIKESDCVGSGHKVSPGTNRERDCQTGCRKRSRLLWLGNGRGYLSALVTGSVTAEKVQAALDAVNPELPHYKQVRAFPCDPRSIFD